MGRRGESFQKRAREKARQEKQEEKRAARQAADDSEDTLTRGREDQLMEQFATLSAKFEADEIPADRFEEERHRIFVELGLEPGD